MSKPDNMEDLFKDKFDGFEARPENDRWSELSANLDADKRKRRFFWLWSGVAGAILVGGVLGLLFLSDDPASLQTTQVPTSESQADTEPIEQAKTDSPTPRSLRQQANQEPAQEANSGRINSGLPNTASLQIEEAFTKSSPAEKNPSPEINESVSKSPEGALISATDTPDGPIKVRKGSEGSIAASKENIVEDIDVTQDDETPSQPVVSELESEPQHLSILNIGVSFGASISKFTQLQSGNSSPYSQVSDEMLNDYHDLRTQLEAPGFTFSQGVSVEYNFLHFNGGKNSLYLGSGIQLVQTTQYLDFNAVETQDDPLNAYVDFAESGKGQASPESEFAYKQILPGSDNRAENKYFSREIPLFLGVRYQLNQRLSLRAQFGTSYRWTTSASYFTPDIDGVGMLSVTGTDVYPGIKPTWQVNGAVGLDIALKNRFVLGINPSFSRALQSNIRFSHWEQQKQNTYGLQLQLYRTF